MDYFVFPDEKPSFVNETEDGLRVFPEKERIGMMKNFSRMVRNVGKYFFKASQTGRGISNNHSAVRIRNDPVIPGEPFSGPDCGERICFFMIS